MSVGTPVLVGQWNPATEGARVVDTQWENLSDDLGPEKIIFMREPSVGLEAILVVDNTAAGPAIGGIRMATDISVEEVFRLARAMTFKNAAAGLRHGGAKAGIIADPDMPSDEKERTVRAFAFSMREITDYIPGPDMGLTEANMAQIHDEIGRVVGLPPVMGGIPLDTLGATGFGLAIAVEVAEEMEAVGIDGARVVVQGFGAVGIHAARFLAQRGAVLVGVSDSRGGLVDPDGLDLDKLIAFKQAGNHVGEFPGGSPVPGSDLIGLDCEIWVPAARPDVFTGVNAGDVRAKVIAQGANIPATAEAEQIFHERGIVVLPDFIANAGGVICGSVEYAGGTESLAFAVIEDKIRANTREVLTMAKDAGILPRQAATDMARARVEEMMTYRRQF
jgi:glutamate dehydrogenase/leucine dehydrogenase